ncbi:MAG TPA: HlyD family secretion protein [Oleiagrimonas sp.]|nr:HlyD family secretion protein [Oleiagrimonas sp.]
MKLVSVFRFSITAVLVLVAALVAWLLWHHYMYSPWTRDARVRAAVVEVAPDVSGRVVRVAVKDNQRVHKGDLLYRIDPVRFENAVHAAQANLDAAKAAARAAGASIAAANASAHAAHATYAMRQAQAERRKRMGNVISREARSNAAEIAAEAHAQWQAAQAGHGKAAAAKARALAAVEQAQVALDLARINLARTRVRAPMNGFVTNLNVFVGDYAHSGQASLALIGSDSFWLYGYFEETKLPLIEVGDQVDIRLMDGTRFKGQVTSVAHGITDRQNPEGKGGLLANVSPTFNWVRLAQRVPVRIRIEQDTVPEGTRLVAGMTATVVLHEPDKTK